METRMFDQLHYLNFAIDQICLFSRGLSYVCSNLNCLYATIEFLDIVNLYDNAIKQVDNHGNVIT